MAQFHHGISKKEPASGIIPMHDAETNTIALLAFSDDADPLVFPLNTPILVTSINRALAASGTEGNLRASLETISAITNPTLIVVRIEDPFTDEVFNQSRVIGSTLPTGQRTGLQAFLTAKSILGLTPKILIAPDVETPEVVQTLASICKKLRAYSYITPRDQFGVMLETMEQVVAYRDTLGFREIEIVWPEWTSENVFLGQLQAPSQISCAGATPSAILENENYILNLEKAPTVDVFVNNSLVASNVNSMFINQRWYFDTALQENALQLGYSVSGTSSNQEIFYNSSSSNITFSLVPKSDGFLDGKRYLAKDALKINGSNPNPTAYKDSTTGTISFCLAAGMVDS